MTTQRLEKLQGHADALVKAFLGLRLNYGLLKPLLGHPGEPLDEPPPGVLRTGVLALRNTLFFSCVLDVVKLSWDNDARTPSIANLIKAVEEPGVVDFIVAHHTAAAVKRRRRSYEYDEQHMRVYQRTEAERQNLNLHSCLSGLRETWQQLDTEAFKSSFLVMRDKRIAHLELRSTSAGYEPVHLGTLGVSPADLETSISAMESIVHDLNDLLRDADFQMERAAKAFDGHGASFWKSLTG